TPPPLSFTRERLPRNRLVALLRAVALDTSKARAGRPAFELGALVREGDAAEGGGELSLGAAAALLEERARRVLETRAYAGAEEEQEGDLVLSRGAPRVVPREAWEQTAAWAAALQQRLPLVAA